MGTTTTGGLLTFEEFERLPDEPGRRELLEGEVIELPPAKRRHNLIAERLFLALREKAGSDAHIGMGYRVSREPDSWLIPDVSIARPDQPGEDYLEGSPALAVEVISDRNRAEDVDLKVKTYLANGGLEVWVVYPRTRCVMVFRNGQLQEFREMLESGVIPGLRIDLRQMFAD